MRVLPFLLLSLCATPVVAQTAPPAAEQAFLAENRTAMDKMMAGMDRPASGDIDKDFADMMTPHHQGAIDMAIVELKYGTNPQLRRIAQEIIVDQQQEIAAMALAVGEPLPASAPVPTQVAPTQVAPQSAKSPASRMAGMVMK